jgi:uncharacterized membrane protein SpoIIM required for sporulation
MREARFLDGARPRWAELEELLTRIDRAGFRRLPASDLDALALGYRAATSDLAMARSRGYDARVVAYLNRLVGRAHARVYVGTSASGWSRAARLFTTVFPREVRRSWKELAICTGITVVTAMATFHATMTDPANAYAFVPADAIPQISSSLHDSNFAFDRSFSPAISAAIITNNIKVAAIAFAGGMTAGIMTISIIGFNGLYLGTLLALFTRHHFGLDFWATISPHGVIELTAIQIAGAGGLVLAAGIVRPGRARRIDAIVDNGRRAVVLMLGVAGMLCVAGLIEGFISPQRFSIPVRFGVGGVTAVALISYLLFAGRAAVTGDRAT